MRYSNRTNGIACSQGVAPRYSAVQSNGYIHQPPSRSRKPEQLPVLFDLRKFILSLIKSRSRIN